MVVVRNVPDFARKFGEEDNRSHMLLFFGCLICSKHKRDNSRTNTVQNSRSDSQLQ